MSYKGITFTGPGESDTPDPADERCSKEQRPGLSPSLANDGTQQVKLPSGSRASPGDGADIAQGSQCFSKGSDAKRTIKPGCKAGPMCAKAGKVNSSQAKIDGSPLDGDERTRRSRSKVRRDKGDEATSPTGQRSSSLPEERKTRGRPVTTGEYEIKKAVLTRREREDEEKRLRELDDPKIAAKLSKNRREYERKYAEELRNAPVEDLARRIIEQVSTVDKVNTTCDKVNTTCGSLKGGDKRSLNVAVSVISAAAAHLVDRVSADEPIVKDFEVEELRRENAKLLKKIAQLEKKTEENNSWNMEVDVEDRPLCRVQEEPPKKKRSRRGKNVIRDDSSSDEDDNSKKEKERIERERIEADKRRDQLLRERERLDKESEKREREAAERNRLRLLKEVVRDGAPEVRRPPLGGKSSAIIEAAIPAEVEDITMNTDPEIVIDAGMELGNSDVPGQGIGNAVDSNMLKRIEVIEAGMEKTASLLETLLRTVNALAAGGPVTAQTQPIQPRGRVIEAEKGGKQGRKGEKEKPPNKSTSLPSAQAAPKPVRAEGKAGSAENNEVALVNPPLEQPPSQLSWAEVTRKKTKKNGKAPSKPTQERRNQQQSKEKQAVKGQGPSKETQGQAKNKPPTQNKSRTDTAKGSGTASKVRRPPKTAAVVLTSLKGEYETLMKEARNKISLKDIGIEGPLKPKRTKTGALLIELP
ncbi:titin homolog, partial [Temnothorax curvispinosus]|uniref:Titin homolog n=1 Tax=Temnothorax curvispinosus TaxID=300111 RepID=A0A6J1PGL8_9HYME